MRRHGVPVHCHRSCQHYIRRRSFHNTHSDACWLEDARGTEDRGCHHVWNWLSVSLPSMSLISICIVGKRTFPKLTGTNSTVATSIVRMVYLPSLLGALDIPWVAAPANIWS